MLTNILNKENLSKQDIIYLLSLDKKDSEKLFEKAKAVKTKYIGNKVYYRGLIELTNFCLKDCYYCGIRKSNKLIERYELNEDEIISSALFAEKHNYASLVIQGGELISKKFSLKIEHLLKKIHQKTSGKLGITLSLGEQSKETYQRWLDAGAHRYLLRIETTDINLYHKIHPQDDVHNYHHRLKSLKDIQDIGFQTGTGVMIGLPFQTIESLADDLLFFKSFDIDMIGMGPYIEHEQTPLFQYKDLLLSKKERLDLSFKMIAVLRILMKDVNIAATTAMQTIDPKGHVKAISVGANVIMPNTTPLDYRENYSLYDDKAGTKDAATDSKDILTMRVNLADNEVALGERGDSPHFFKRKKRLL